MEPTIQKENSDYKIKEQRLVFTKSSYGMPSIIGIALIIATSIGCYAFLQARSSDHVFSVTGSATKFVTSDRVKWISSISRVVTQDTLKAGYGEMAKDLSLTQAFFDSAKIPADSITTSPIFMNEIYDNGNSVGIKRYTLQQTFEITSNDVSHITDLSKNTNSLIDQGVVFSTTSLEYYYSSLPTDRVNLLADALKDAHSRADVLANSSGRKVGDLMQVSSGVVQLMPKDSVDVSDYGTYDTSSIDKTVMVTVKASFSVK